MTSFLQLLKRTARPLVCPFDPILEATPRGSTIADIGCGGGFLLGLLAQRVSPRRLHGFEVNPAAVVAARDYLHQVAPEIPASISHYDGVAFPDELSEADVVVLVDVLHHIPPQDQATFLARLFEKMRPSAILILKDIDAGRPFLCFFNKLHDLAVTGAMGNELTAAETGSHLRSLGFEIQSSGAARKLWYPHYWFVAKKPS
jgi:2-polyprenyl-3-methyl-5-hydroxy-6-metoxy-1,4-benzoquinol methylase